MSSLVQRRARIARVRSIQHLQASAEAAQAEAKVVQLETTVERLAQLGAQMSAVPGATFAATLGSAGEMVQRLATVRVGLADSIATARRLAERQAALRTEARIREEAADRLRDRAHAEREARRQAKLDAIPRVRRDSGERR